MDCKESFSWAPERFLNRETIVLSRLERIRTMAGTSVAWSRRFALEGNWNHQHDTRWSVTTINAFNLILQVFFETHRAK